MSDRETGKPKGFGFCEFRDQETAKSAIRYAGMVAACCGACAPWLRSNLDNYDFHGRSLRVRFADDTQTDSRGSGELLFAGCVGVGGQRARVRRISGAWPTIVRPGQRAFAALVRFAKP